MQAIVPTAQRAIASPACALSHAVKPLLSNILNDLVLTVKNIFPIAFTHSSNKNGKIFPSQHLSSPGYGMHALFPMIIAVHLQKWTTLKSCTDHVVYYPQHL